MLISQLQQDFVTKLERGKSTEYSPDPLFQDLKQSN